MKRKSNFNTRNFFMAPLLYVLLLPLGTAYSADVKTQEANSSYRIFSGDVTNLSRMSDVSGKSVQLGNRIVINPFATKAQTVRFLNQATFGAPLEEIQSLTNKSASDWVTKQFRIKPTLHLGRLLAEYPDGLEGEDADLFYFADSNSWWHTAVTAKDQLRQRMAFALSQIVVIANPGPSFLGDRPQAMAHIMDIITRNAFGNYRQLLEEVTYSPAMGIYLTYAGNEKADPIAGTQPDENYAREIMQLFTIGLTQLNMDGTQKLDSTGKPIETYTNKDITGLARVFTGLDFYYRGGGENAVNYTRSMEMLEELHSLKEKKFLGHTIPAGTDGETSIKLALDYIFNHPNVAPFIGRQLIQRFVTSHPSRSYIKRVATAFEIGHYTLPNEVTVGTGERGDLKATIAAVLFDPEANNETQAENSIQGKVREPVIRFTHWARAFNINSADPSNEVGLYEAMNPENLNQHAYKSRSVFNFYRPGYVAPGTATGAANLTIPELQIVNESSAVGYANFMNRYIRGIAAKWEPEEYFEYSSFIADYRRELKLANDPKKLVQHLNLLLTGNRLQTSTTDRIISVLNEVPITNFNRNTALNERVHIAILMVMTAPDYIVQR